MISKTQEDFIWGAVVGGTLAAAFTLFLTPISGSEARKHIVNGFQKIKGKEPRSLSPKRKAQARVKTRAVRTKRSTRPSQSVSASKATDVKKHQQQ